MLVNLTCFLIYLPRDTWPERAECPNWWGRRLGDFDPRTKVFVQLEQLPTEWHCQRCEPFPQWFPNLELKIWHKIEHFAALSVFLVFCQTCICKNWSLCNDIFDSFLEGSHLNFSSPKEFFKWEQVKIANMILQRLQVFCNCRFGFLYFKSRWQNVEYEQVRMSWKRLKNSCYIIRNIRRLIASQEFQLSLIRAVS